MLNYAKRAGLSHAGFEMTQQPLPSAPRGGGEMLSGGLSVKEWDLPHSSPHQTGFPLLGQLASQSPHKVLWLFVLQHKEIAESPR